MTYPTDEHKKAQDEYNKHCRERLERVNTALIQPKYYVTTDTGQLAPYPDMTQADLDDLESWANEVDHRYDGAWYVIRWIVVIAIILVAIAVLA